MSKKTYDYRKQNGLCVKCGIPALNGKVHCQSCLEKEKIKKRENREFFKQMGLCPRCGKNRLFGDEKNCPECLAKMCEINSKSRQKNIDKTSSYSKDYYKKDIEKLKEKGLCRGCRKRKSAEGKTYCKICLEKKRKAKRERMGGCIERSERPSYGLCYTCGKELDRDGRVCLKCAEIMTKNLPSAHCGNDSWRRDNKIIFLKI